MDTIGGSRFTHAASLSSTSVRAIVSADASSGTVDRTITTSLISVNLWNLWNPWNPWNLWNPWNG